MLRRIYDMTTAEILSEYNFLTGKGTTKFSSRHAGECQLEDAREKNPEKVAELEAKGGNDGMYSTKPPKYTKATSKQRGAFIKSTWNDPVVRERRVLKERVKVNDGSGEWVEYRSVLAAFKALNLPYNKHIKFRIDLKVRRSMTLEHFGATYDFQIIEKEEDNKNGA